MLPLSERHVRDDVVTYVAAESSANGLRAVRVTRVTVRDGNVRVELAMTETSPVLGTLLGSPGGVLVTATATARTAVR